MASKPTKLTRGERSNNPGNIDRNTTKWQGMSPDQSGDKRFVVFTSPVFGIRALAKVLLSYYRQHGLNTPRKIVNRWAPPVENDTGAYVTAVASALGITSDDQIVVTDEDVLRGLTKAIIHHENGRCVYGDDVIEDGVRRALG